MSWLEKLLPSKIQQTDPTERRQMPEGLWIKCPSCENVLYKTDLEHNENVCPQCGHHHRISARARLNAFLDGEGRYEIGQEVLPVDALKFKDSRKYLERLKEALENTGETDALIVMGGAVKSINVVVACFEFDFMGGSMGSVVGERFVRGVETAIEQKVPFICFTATGGARMQEGLLSLMQMAKTNAALTRLAKKGLPYISVLTDPTMGGVSAGFAFVGDIVIAEPKALSRLCRPARDRIHRARHIARGFPARGVPADQGRCGLHLRPPRTAPDRGAMPVHAAAPAGRRDSLNHGHQKQ